MRILGFLMLAGGVLFAILLLLAQLGGGQLGIVPVFSCALLIFIGWRFARSGAALARASTAAAASAASQTATVELPLSAAAAAAIGRQNDKSWRIVLAISGAMLGFFVILGAIFALLDRRQEEALVVLAIFSVTGLGAALITLTISWANTRRLMNRDLRTGTYLRTTGPVQIVPMFNGAILRLADRAFLVQGNVGVRELGGLQDGTVDYSPYGHVVLAAWDASGQPVYSAPGYGSYPEQEFDAPRANLPS